MGKNGTIGRVTIPTDLDVIRETKELIERWGADAIRDCDGTEYPDELKEEDAKVYATYYTTRKDNEWAKANLDEVQQMYIMTRFPHRRERFSFHSSDGSSLPGYASGKHERRHRKMVGSDRPDNRRGRTLWNMAV